MQNNNVVVNYELLCIKCAIIYHVILAVYAIINELYL